MKNQQKLTLIVQMALVSGCWYTPPDDAGHQTFVVWALKAILARPPTSDHEVQALVKLAQLEGRGAVVDVLLEQPEFIDYWGQVLLEDLMVGAGDDDPADNSCFTELKLATNKYDDLVHHLTYKAWTTEFCPSSGPTITADLVTNHDTSLLPEWDVLGTTSSSGLIARLEAITRTPTSTTASTAAPVVRGGREYLTTGLDRVAPPKPGILPPRGSITTPSCESFTMADAVRASLTEDRLDVLYRVGMVPLAVNHSQEGATYNFFKGYIDRDMGCVPCHTTDYGASNAIAGNGHWDRFEPANWVDLEGMVFSYNNGGEHYGGAGGDAAYINVRSFFRDDAFLTANGKNPFGIDSACTTANGRRGFATTLASNNNQRVGFAGVNGTTYGPMKLVDEFALGVAALYDPDLADAPLYPVANPGAAAIAPCLGCHKPGNTVQAPPDLVAHTRYMHPSRIEDIVRNGSPGGRMVGYDNPNTNADDAGALALAQNAAAYLSAAPGHVSQRFYVDRHAGFAHLVAMTAANNIFKEMTGKPLDIQHDFPRNKDSAELLAELTRELVDHQWSIKAVIRRIALSDHVNRRAPIDSPHDPYELPLVVAPWADVPGENPDPFAGEDRAGQGDVGTRMSIQNLLWQVHHALGWPAPPAIPETGYIGRTFVEEMGVYTDISHPGFVEFVLPSMLAWEAEVGTCTKPAGVTEDYVDVLTDRDYELTLEQAAVALKGRLLGDGQLWEGQALSGGGIASSPPVYESSLLEDMMGTSLDELAADHPDALRNYCAVLLQSPQFILGGLPAWPSGHAPPAPDADVPCVDDWCTFVEHCEHYRDEAVALGYDAIQCGIGGIVGG